MPQNYPGEALANLDKFSRSKGCLDSSNQK